jgi:hypothetical protein
MMIQRNTGAAQGPHTLMETVSFIGQGLILEDLRASIYKATVQHCTSLGKEQSIRINV